MKQIDTLTFRKELHMEGSFGAYSIGEHDCEMGLWLADDRTDGFIEFCFGEEAVGIGLWFDAEGNLTDYDGVMSFPPQAIELLERNGFTVGEDFR